MRNWCDPNKYIIIKRFSRSFPTSIWVANIGVVLQMQLARITHKAIPPPPVSVNTLHKMSTTIFGETGKDILIYKHPHRRPVYEWIVDQEFCVYLGRHKLDHYLSLCTGCSCCYRCVYRTFIGRAQKQ